MLDQFFPLYIISFLSTLVFTVILERRLLPHLARIAKQPIYAEGPEWHMKKSGTPTMGGLAFVISSGTVIVFSALIMVITKHNKIALSLIICLVYAMLNALIGIIDDHMKLKHKKNKGLTPLSKLITQTASAILFLIFRAVFVNGTTELAFSFGRVDIGWLYYPLALFILVGIVNSANLTDGIDGLAASVAFAIGVSLFYLSAALSIDCALIASVLMGAALGFLVFNLHPAKIFMGDTGSLFFGAFIVSSVFTLSNPIIIIPIAAVYAFEGLSVIIQVVYFKITRKRVFKMAPFHHHLEKCGWTENKICIAAMLATLVCSIPVYIFYLP